MKIGIIAGQGALPELVAHKAAALGVEPVIIALKSLADGEFPERSATIFAITQIESIIAHFKQHKVTQIIMVGKVHRSAIAAGPVDATSAVLLREVMSLGDDAALRAIVAVLIENGLQIIPVTKILKNHTLPEDFDGGARHDTGHDDSLALAIELHQQLGSFDVGQAMIVQGHQVIAIEAAEGTDAMIERAGQLMGDNAACRLFLKATKSAQDKLLDPPVIGADTIMAAAQAGITHMAIEANHCLLAEPFETISDICAKHNIYLCAITMPDETMKG